MRAMKTIIALASVLMFMSGCAAGTRNVSLTYQTPGKCHFDHGTHYSVRVTDGSSELVVGSCETTEQILSGRF